MITNISNHKKGLISYFKRDKMYFDIKFRALVNYLYFGRSYHEKDK